MTDRRMLKSDPGLIWYVLVRLCISVSGQFQFEPTSICISFTSVYISFTQLHTAAKDNAEMQ